MIFKIYFFKRVLECECRNHKYTSVVLQRQQVRKIWKGIFSVLEPLNRLESSMLMHLLYLLIFYQGI